MLLLAALSLSGCYRPAWFVGVGGKYNEAKTEIMRAKGGDLNKAIINLEEVVRTDPTYRDSLTMLGRAYYKAGRYEDAYKMVQRAVVVDKNDEVAWLVLGMVQLRLGQEQAGYQTLRGGLTLFTKANGSDDGYKGYETWDKAGRVKIAARRAVVAVLKGEGGEEERNNVIRSVENTLAAMDHEIFLQDARKNQDLNVQYSDD
jgi:tetratricopeptide (TPR) repeat protein